MTATSRVRKHRAKLRTEQCSRLDVWIGGWIVEGIRQLRLIDSPSDSRFHDDAPFSYV